MFDALEADIRERFVDCQRMLLYLKGLPNADLHPAPFEIRSLRGLWLVNLYGVTEKSVNMIADEIVNCITSDAVASSSLKPSLHSIFHFPKIQALKSCGDRTVIGKSLELLRASHSVESVTLSGSPLPDKLQNVDAETIFLLCDLLSLNGYQIEAGRRGRLNNLKERRNAIAHGRETPHSVGERFNFQGLQDLFTITNEEVFRFMTQCKIYCEEKAYLS
ncbi:HEPN domain-containing protein [Epibacterium ulvae]|uniref:HEPN domain-containing protein n=1 Tax=Epibacterium ulvae TaxID=1156985 RepID=UPI002491FB70|nr:MAE_28990/MAE_18760 family HEPN-like nuclease [Epibacterium ulvae]